MAPVIRQYAPQDAAATWRVFDWAVRITGAEHYSPEQIAAWNPGTVDLQEWGARRAAAWTVVAEVEWEVIGFSDLTDDGELDMLYVDPDHAGRGVARELVEHVLAEARRRRMSRVTVRASRSAQPVLEHLGFGLDHDNPANQVRGVLVPNASMSLRLSP